MTFMAKGLMMILLLLAVSACGLAQSCIPLEIQPFDYTLDVHGTRYVGTAVVSPVPGEPVYELTAEGYTGVREDAERIYALLDHAGEAMEEKHINREYTHSYIIGTKHVHFSPACLYYGADLEKLDQFNRAGAWISGLHDTYTDVYRGYQLPWREIPLIAQTDFGARVEEAFAILENMGIAFGEPEAVAYWDVFAMQSEYDRSQFDQEPHTFEEADAILEIQMPTYLNGMRLKAASMGTSDASLNDCRTSIRVRMTQQQIMEIDAGDCRFKAPQQQRGGEPIPPEQALAQYEQHLNQMLVLEEGMTEITGILLEYDVWHRYTAGVFSPTFHFYPVWSIYTAWSCNQPAMMIHALDGTAAAPARRNVPHRICTFLKETFLTLRFAEGALLCCGIYVLGDLVWWGAKSFLYVFGASTLFSSFIYLFPVCAAFPYALRYRENRKNHLDYMILQRCSVFRYLNTLFVRTAVSGFAVMAVGTLLFLGLIPVCFPHAVLSYELEEIGGLIMPFLETVAQAENWFAYFGFYTLLIGISGVFWGVLALTVSAWVDNTYAIYIFPILFLLLYPLVTFGSMSVLCYLAFIYRGRRNCRES